MALFLAYASAKGRDPAGPGAVSAPGVGWGLGTSLGVPEDVALRTKPQLARRMLERAVESGVPFGWVAGDEVYGNDRNLRLWLEREEIPHVLAVRSNEKLWALTDKGPRQVRADRLAPAHHAFELAHAYLAVIWHQGDGGRTTRAKGGYSCRDEGLIPLTVPEVRRLLTRLVWTPEHSSDFVLGWSQWRRRHPSHSPKMSLPTTAIPAGFSSATVVLVRIHRGDVPMVARRGMTGVGTRGFWFGPNRCGPWRPAAVVRAREALQWRPTVAVLDKIGGKPGNEKYSRPG